MNSFILKLVTLPLASFICACVALVLGYVTIVVYSVVVTDTFHLGENLDMGALIASLAIGTLLAVLTAVTALVTAIRVLIKGPNKPQMRKGGAP